MRTGENSASLHVVRADERKLTQEKHRKEVFFLTEWLTILKILSSLERDGLIFNLQYAHLKDTEYLVRFVPLYDTRMQPEGLLQKYIFAKDSYKDYEWKVWCERGSYARNNSSAAV